MELSSYSGFSVKTEKQNEANPVLYFTFHYIDDVISLNNSRFGDYLDHIYTIGLEIEYKTDTAISASYLDYHL